MLFTTSYSESVYQIIPIKPLKPSLFTLPTLPPEGYIVYTYVFTESYVQILLPISIIQTGQTEVLLYLEFEKLNLE